MASTGSRRAAVETTDPGSVRDSLRAGSAVTIGDVLVLLQGDFPDVTISKIRFLEDQGLVAPDRTPAGYRKFTAEHVDRLRSILTLQRDHFLPLRVIRDLLVPREAPAELRVVPGHGSPMPQPSTAGARDRAWLRRETGCDDVVLAEFEEHGLLRVPGTEGYDGDDIETVRAAVSLSAVGLRARHLRFLRIAADRETALVDQAVAAMPRSGSRSDSDAEIRRELAASLLRLHAALVAGRLGR